MAEIRIKLSKLSERVNLHLDVPLMKRRVVRKVASVPPLMVSEKALASVDSFYFTVTRLIYMYMYTCCTMEE